MLPPPIDTLLDIKIDFTWETHRESGIPCYLTI